MIFLTVAFGIVIIILAVAVVFLTLKVDNLQRSIKLIDEVQCKYTERTMDLEDRSTKTEESLNKVWHILKNKRYNNQKKPKQDKSSK